jgi:hypothetical protein
MKKEFIFILIKPDGSEYEQAVSADNAADAERRLKNLLDIIGSADKISGLRPP